MFFGFPKLYIQITIKILNFVCIIIFGAEKRLFLYNKILHFTFIFSAYLGLSECTIYLCTLCKNNILESKIILH